MAERYSDFIWDYYGGRPAGRRTYPGIMPGPVFGMQASELSGKGYESGNGFRRGMSRGSRREMLWAMELKDDNQETGRDMEYFQAMYPEKMKKLQMRAGELCDTIDYEGSVLYDEYPDRIGLRKLCEEICREEISENMDEKEAEWIRAAAEVLLYHEICRRRVRRRGLKRKYW
ncbi:MAG: hypothetical protein HFI63_02860 [Lachnospiraceae bacterium]|nr:hypothetical protein [Lachnospiraceae bacterium]